MTHSYSKRSKKPFGTFTAFQMLRERYKGNSIETFSKNFYDNWINHIGGTRSLYVVVSKKVLLSEISVSGGIVNAYSALQLAEKTNSTARVKSK